MHNSRDKSYFLASITVELRSVECFTRLASVVIRLDRETETGNASGGLRGNNDGDDIIHSKVVHKQEPHE